MKKLRILLLLVAILLAAAAAFVYFKSGTQFSNSKKIIQVRKGQTDKTAFIKLLQKDSINTGGLFEQIANIRGLWGNIKEGNYEVKKGASAFAIVSMFKNNVQAPVNLVINKLRLPTDLAKLIAQKTMNDSASVAQLLYSSSFLASNNADTNNLLSLIIPNTYQVKFASDPQTIVNKVINDSKKFWNDKRTSQAATKNLTPNQVIILASIVEEETNKEKDKGNIASVYLNRLKVGQKLEADPTCKFALRNFAAKQITFDMLKYVHPFNTYVNKGLPPGPICTPSINTIDAVLQAPETNYMFFVSNPDFSGTSIFATTYQEHLVNAAAWRKALAEYKAKNPEKFAK
jgi:UPF0755 protein